MDPTANAVAADPAMVAFKGDALASDSEADDEDAAVL